MKKTNKGFSLVELIIVIAIMAILAGALAPALIKYINKSRASAAISNGQRIATAIQTALSNEAVFEKANDVAETTYSTWIVSDDPIAVEVAKTLGKNGKHKAKKGLDGETECTDQDYHITIHPVPTEDQDMVVVKVGGTDDKFKVYPTTGSAWKEPGTDKDDKSGD